MRCAREGERFVVRGSSFGVVLRISTRTRARARVCVCVCDRKE